MKRVFECLPRFEDHFPRMRRGHGSTHPDARYRNANDGNGNVKVRNACVCVAEGCKGLQGHRDQAANRKDWERERGIERNAQ